MFSVLDYTEMQKNLLPIGKCSFAFFLPDRGLRTLSGNSKGREGSLRRVNGTGLKYKIKLPITKYRKSEIKLSSYFGFIEISDQAAFCNISC